MRLALFAVGCCIAFAVRSAISWLLTYGPVTAYILPSKLVRICTASPSARPLSGVWHVQAYKVLGNVMSLVGGFASLSCSLLMPSLFYLILFWKELTRGSRAGVQSLSRIVRFEQ